MLLRTTAASGCLAALAACSVRPTTEVPRPSEISLHDAVLDVVDSLQAGHARSLAGYQLGLNVCTVTIVLDVVASGKNDGKLGLSVGTPTVAPVSASATGSYESTQEGYRGNTITMVLASPDCIKAGVVGGGKASADDPTDKSAGGGGTTAKAPIHRGPTRPVKPPPPTQPGQTAAPVRSPDQTRDSNPCPPGTVKDTTLDCRRAPVTQ